MSKDKKSKGTKHFKEVIQKYLDKRGDTDLLFTKQLNNPKKNIEDCIKYILNTVQKSGAQGFTDDEVFNMAVHYYDEENIELGKDLDMKVVVNHKVELTLKEVADAKKEAKQKIFDAEYGKMRKKPGETAKTSTSTGPAPPPTLF